MRKIIMLVVCLAFVLLFFKQSAFAQNQPSFGGGSPAKDPGVRAGTVNAGKPLSTLSPSQLQYFTSGFARFNEVEDVAEGLGPTFNSTSCGNCHSQPSTGGTSPRTDQFPNIGPNPQIEAASAEGANNKIPFFITPDGPVREARFPFVVAPNGSVTRMPDGGVHALFTIAGRSDAGSCALAQPNFDQMQQAGNLIFRIPTPVFGAGLIENIPDIAILANMNANGFLKQRLGISGRPNFSGNDGSITRFGWKAQNKSLEIFTGEAYSVEMGVTNELFPNERSTPPASCIVNSTPEDFTRFDETNDQILNDTIMFAHFMRFLAPPTPSAQGIPGNPSATSIHNGQALFSQIHCDTCHTPVLQTGTSKITAALNNQPAALYSDLLLHSMGSGLADNISQGAAGPSEFRTAPLWGLGQRIFLLHDGRSGPANGGLLHAIQQHASNGSEANAVVSNFNQLSAQQKQDLLNFLRSL